MNPIRWPELIGALIKSGMTQPELAAAARCSQSSISDLLNGRTTDPRTSAGLELIRLANARCGYDIRLEPKPACACGAWEMAPEGEAARTAPPPGAVATAAEAGAPASAMLLGGRREEDHVFGYGVVDLNGPDLAAEIHAVGHLVGDTPKGEAADAGR